MWTSPTRSTARLPPARARCWWSTPARASRPRRWPMSIRRSTNDHEIVPVLNKIDLPAAEPDRVRQQIEDVIGLDATDAVEISAKTGIGITDVLEAIVQQVAVARGRPRQAAEGHAGRQLVRPLSRRRRVGAHRRRRHEEGPEGPDDVDGRPVSRSIRSASSARSRRRSPN